MPPTNAFRRRYPEEKTVLQELESLIIRLTSPKDATAQQVLRCSRYGSLSISDPRSPSCPTTERK